MNEAPENEELTQPQKVQHVKNGMLTTLTNFHNQLYYFIDTLPLAEKCKEHALMNLVQGTRWAENGIQALEFEVVKFNEGEKDAAQEGNQQENNSEEHQDGNQIGKEAEPSSSDCLLESGQEQKQEEVSPTT